MIGVVKALIFLIAFFGLCALITLVVGRLTHGKGFMNKPATLGDVFVMLGSTLVALAICMTVVDPWLNSW